MATLRRLARLLLRQRSSVRVLSCDTVHCKGLHYSAAQANGNGQLNQPLSVDKMPRFAGIATMMRLPLQEGKPEGLDACFVGVPMDIGCSYRSGPRLAPRQIRHESSALRVFNMSTGAAPFESLQVADIGDVPVNPFDLNKAVDIITEYYRRILQANCIPLAMGGDHLLSLPILRAMKEKHGKMGMVQIDAHADTTDSMLGEKVTHSTPFRRAVEEGLLSPEHVVQIGLRGTSYSSTDYDWPKQKRFWMVTAEECWGKSLKPLMEAVREKMGDRPVYITIDIDGIDPSYCPGTGVREIGGLTVMQALEIVRGCKGLNMVGGDVVEVNPAYDPDGTTSVVAANLLFEVLCVLPGVKYKT